MISELIFIYIFDCLRENGTKLISMCGAKAVNAVRVSSSIDFQYTQSEISVNAFDGWWRRPLD